VALRLVSDRESEIERFIRQDYWQVAAILGTPRNESFEARLTAFEGSKLQKLDISSQAQADDIEGMLKGAAFKTLSVEAKPTRRNPAPPFTTSTLQQAASSRLGFSATRTMQIAQRLYEGIDIGGETAGLITYMRTDGVQMAPEALSAARTAIAKEFGDKYLPEKPRYYTAKAKNAQEAHEAIRPTDFFRTPAAMRGYLDADQARLYEIIWKRATASQMQPAEIERTTVEIEAVNGSRRAELRAVGSVIRFDGFIAAYTDQREEDAEDEENRRLPEIRENETLAREAIGVTKHTTEPPPRYSEASLIKKLEELGIGRPSTYTAILKTLEDRDYVTIEKRRLMPQAKGRLLSAFLESFFERYVEYDFTASLEEKLDEISDGKLAWKDVLRDFWKDFSASVDGIKELRVTDVLDALNEELAPLVFPAREDGSDPRICPKCGSGKLSLKLGRNGAFVGCSNYPECNFTRQFGAVDGDANGGNDGPKVLGKDPYTAEEITLRSGRFGPYVQRGDGKEAKRSSLPKGWAVADIDHEKALALLSLPRDVGKHPETGKMISAGLGRYGPFVLNDGTYANLDSIEDVFSIGLNRAVSVIAEKQAKGKGARNGGTSAALKDLGEHPDGGGKITVRDGRYGPYVNHGKVNATLPKGKEPASVTLEEALALLAERAAKSGGNSGKAPRKPAAKKPTKKSAAKKPTAKKA
jgi:DNA topoisomerase-1